MPSPKAIEVATELMMPPARELATAAGSELTEFVGAMFAREGEIAQQRLPRRRFIRPDPGCAELDSEPAQVDWKTRKAELSETIARRIMQPRLTEQEFFQPVREFPQGDRQIVGKILELSVGSSTETGLMHSINSVEAKLQQRISGLQPLSFAASPESPGNMLGYLFRKAQLSYSRTFHFDSSRAALMDASPGAPVLVFDDLRYLNGSARAALVNLQKHHPVFAVDVSSFERAVNFIDFANGQSTVVKKLDRLLNETKELIGKEPGLEQEQAIKRVLNDGFDQSVADFNGQLEHGVNPIITLRSEPVAPLAAFKPVVTPERIAAFFEEHYSHSSEARIAVAEILAEDVEFYTLQGLIPKLKDLQEALKLSAQRQGLDPEKDTFVVAAEGGRSSSDGFMTYLYKQATGMADGRIFTLKALQALQQDRKLDGRRVVALDDAIYNGWQAGELLDEALVPFPRVALAALSSFNKFAIRMRQGGPEQLGMRELVSLQTDFGLGVSTNGAVNPFYASIPEALRDSIGTSDPVEGLQTLKVFPHMVSDTSPYWLQSLARTFPLTFEHAFKLK